MTKPDIIISWPRNCDYPLWRQFIREQRKRFNEIIVVFTDTFENDDYSTFVRNVMFPDHVIFVDNPPVKSGEDWRDIAIHQALLHSYNAQWIWFTEQDFFVKPGFFEKFYKHVDQGDEVIAVYDGPRMHPCSILIKREALNKTRKNFGVVPNVSDHFSLIQKDLEGQAKIYKMPINLYFHMNGLSSNFSQVERGGMPNYQPAVFNKYIELCTLANIEKNERFEQICDDYLHRIDWFAVKNDPEFRENDSPFAHSPATPPPSFEAKSEK